MSDSEKQALVRRVADVRQEFLKKLRPQIQAEHAWLLQHFPRTLARVVSEYMRKEPVCTDNKKGNLEFQCTWSDSVADCGISIRMEDFRAQIMTSDGEKFVSQVWKPVQWFPGEEFNGRMEISRGKDDLWHYRLNYWRTGKVYIECSFKDGKLHGLFKHWDEKGEAGAYVAIECTFENGRLVSDVKYCTKTLDRHQYKYATERRLLVSLSDIGSIDTTHPDWSVPDRPRLPKDIAWIFQPCVSRAKWPKWHFS